MQALILAAGKSTRTYPLTLNRPKPLLKVLDKTIIERNLDQLVGLVDEVVIVVGFMKDKIIDKIGDSYNGIKIVYVEQKEQLGTGHAVMSAEQYLKDRFIIMPGDDLFSAVDLKRLVEHKYACLADESEHPERYGVFTVDDRNKKGEEISKNNNLIITDIEEKPAEPKSNLVNTACWVMDRKILDLMKTVGVTERGEYEITCALKKLCGQGGEKGGEGGEGGEEMGEEVRAVVVSDYWLPMGYPWHYLEANVFFLRKFAKAIDKNSKQGNDKKENNEKGNDKQSIIKGTIEEGATVKGVVFLGEGSIIKAESYVEGPVWIGKNSTIAPNAYLRKDTIIMDNVRIRAEAYDVVIMDNTTAKHVCYLGHSVIGENCNIAAGTITADYRHDGKNNHTLVKGCKIDSGRRKLGAFIGDNVNTGIGTLIYPGRKIWNNMTTLPGEVVKEDKNSR